VQPIDAVDHMPEEGWLSEFVEVDIAKLGDAHTVECLGKAGERDVVPGDFNPVALDFACIERQPASTVQSDLEKTTPGYVRFGEGWKKCHISSYRV
jgi:hypothetical protein